MLFVDTKTSELEQLLREAHVYEKIATVTVVEIEETLTVQTIVSNGYVETIAEGHVGDFIVTNPDGEQYILPRAMFFARYEETDVVGVWKAKGFIKAIPNPYAEEIEILAPWGEPQFGEVDCFLAVTIDGPEDEVISDDRYIIEGAAFSNTYRLVHAK